MDVDLNGATWRKSSYSNGTGGNCVEVADLPSGRAVVQGIQAGELCAELEPGQAAGICRESPGHDPSFVECVDGNLHADGNLPCLHGMITAAKRRGRAVRALENRWSTGSERDT